MLLTTTLTPASLTPRFLRTCFHAAITGCKPGQCADPLTCILGVKSKCGCPAGYAGGSQLASQVLIESADAASYCSPICAKIKGSSLVCGGRPYSGYSNPKYSAFCETASKTAASCRCGMGYEFELSQTLQTDPLSGTKYYTGTCICPAGRYKLLDSATDSFPSCKGERNSATTNIFKLSRSAVDTIFAHAVCLLHASFTAGGDL
jgi:hypothetical protein